MSPPISRIQEEAGREARALWWFNWRVVLLFALMGPAVGYAGAVLIGVALTGSVDPTPFSPGILELAYLFGVVPASLTGLALPAALRLVPATLRKQRWAQVVAATLTGFLLSWLFFAALTPFKALALACVGGCSAAVCSIVAAWLRVMPRPFGGSA